ncbi:glycosyltransferase family 9 protein [Tunicatimonas pelagia]|uniref:glycosyltransferase family 9 protein n=1 Tax=Tunicatimonas pelagia TaxID=931531 RepID=UPI0026664BAE|nr:glycosyltransferase family 9 protein [Tunicatimonas pelagia]WKN41306.1 glycosyltransferase family 9 protein [Tunicatimonas pelagia]
MAKKLKVLILRFSSIGDIVLTTPVPRTLKTQLEAEVHYATKQQYHSLMATNPYIDKIYLLENKLSSLIAQLRLEKYDYIIDLHNNLRTQIIKKRLGIKSHSFSKLNVEKWLMVNFKIDKLPNVHIVDRYMQTVAPLGVKMDSLGLDYFIPEQDEVEPDWLPETHREGFVAYAIGAQFNTKKLPVDRMIELCDRINKPIILLGDKNDWETGEQVAQFFARDEASHDYEEKLAELGKKALIWNACGKFNLNQSASIVRQARYVFTHDTGLMHIAAAFKKNIFCIWGNTIPAFGMYPYRTKFTVLENNRVSCRPCSKIGYQQCPKKHFRCMRGITFDFYLP